MDRQFENVADKKLMVTKYAVEGVIVCYGCISLEPPFINSLVYLGDVPTVVRKLHYREKSILSPIKLMTQITKKSTLYSGRIGHYELKGYVGLKHNYEFAGMAYSGTVSLSFRRGAYLENVNMGRVRDAFKQLRATHSLMAGYDESHLDKIIFVIEYHVKEHDCHVKIDDAWKDNMMVSLEAVAPLAATVGLNDLVIGKE